MGKDGILEAYCLEERRIIAMKKINRTLKIIFSISIILNFIPTSDSKPCEIWGFDTQDFFPLPLFEGEDGLMYLDNKFNFIEVEDGKSFNISCIGSHLQNYNLKYKKLDSVKVDCRNGTLFSDEWFPGKALSMKRVSCNQAPNSIQKNTGNKCGEEDKGELIEIYLESKYQNNHYLYEVCFDDSIKQPIYVKHILEKKNLNNFNNKGPKFVYGDSEIFSDIGIQEFYEYNHYREILYAKLGQYGWQYLLNKNWIINGSLIEALSFPLDPLQRVTYDYINYLPIWDEVQRGSWLSSFTGLVSIAKNINITVYSGAWGVLSLKDADGIYHEIRLESSNSMRYPLPQWLYRVAYNEVSKTGIAFLILNNPSASIEEAKELAEIFPCGQVCPDWTWINNATPQKGYVVCCEVDDFRKVVKDLPEFETVGLLPYFFTFN